MERGQNPLKKIYRFADTDVSVETVYPAFGRMAEAYEKNADPDAAFSIAVTEADIAEERRRSAEQDAREGVPVRNWSDGYLETLAIYRKLCDRLIERDVLLFHSSAIEADGKAYLFTAPSGTGKSTHTRLWREVFGDRVRMINDDKPLLRFGENGVTVFGTPWDGKHRLSENVSAPVRGIAVLSRGEENRIRRMSAVEAFPHLLRQTYRPETEEGAKRMTELVFRLAAEAPAYALACNMEPEAARVAFEAMKGTAK